MKLNYPGSPQEPLTKPLLWTEFHPLALFNCRSLFHRLRAELDHEQVFRDYLRAVREEAFFKGSAIPNSEAIGSVLETLQGWKDHVTGAAHDAYENAVQALAALQTALAGWQPVPLKLAAAGASELVLDAKQTDNNCSNASIELHGQEAFARGRFHVSSKGLPPAKPCALFLIDPEAASELCAAIGAKGKITEEQLRRVFADEVLRNNDDVGTILSGVPSSFATSDQWGQVEFILEDVPHGNYDLPRDHWKIVCYAPL